MRFSIKHAWARINPSQLCLVLAVVLVANSLMGHLLYSMTPSLRYRLFFKTTVEPAELNGVKRGDYVTFNVKHPAKANVYIGEIKRVGCAAGDTLYVTPSWDYMCGGTLLGRAKPFDMHGNPTNRFRYDGKIPPGMLFLIGDHKDSYDSRYLGLVPVTLVKEKAWPLM